MCVCKYLIQRVRRISEKNGKSFKGVSKTNKKKYMKRVSFITQFKIEFFTTVYRLMKSAWKNAWPGSRTQPHYEASGNLHIREVIVTCSKLALG